MIRTRRIRANLPQMRDEVAERRAVGHDDGEMIEAETTVLWDRVGTAPFAELEQRPRRTGPELRGRTVR